MTKPLMASRDLAIEDVRENFEAEHGPDGGAWAPWSMSYVASGQAGAGILKRTFDLMGSATSPAAWPISARELFFSFGALPEYGIWHQTGASRISAGRGVTRRKALALSRGFISAGFTPFAMEGAHPTYFASTHANPLPARPFAGIEESTQFAILDIWDAWFGGAVGLAVGGGGRMQFRAGGRFAGRVTGGLPT
jgi:phage gpG-like protein